MVLGPIDYTIIIIYLVGTVLFGAYIGRKIKSGKDYFFLSYCSYMGGKYLGKVPLLLVAYRTIRIDYVNVCSLDYGGCR